MRRPVVEQVKEVPVSLHVPPRPHQEKLLRLVPVQVLEELDPLQGVPQPCLRVARRVPPSEPVVPVVRREEPHVPEHEVTDRPLLVGRELDSFVKKE